MSILKLYNYTKVIISGQGTIQSLNLYTKYYLFYLFFFKVGFFFLYVDLAVLELAL